MNAPRQLRIRNRLQFHITITNQFENDKNREKRGGGIGLDLLLLLLLLLGYDAVHVDVGAYGSQRSFSGRYGLVLDLHQRRLLRPFLAGWLPQSRPEDRKSCCFSVVKPHNQRTEPAESTPTTTSMWRRRLIQWMGPP